MDLRDADQRAWLGAMYRRARELAPDALVVNNSACEPNFHVRTDIDDRFERLGLTEVFGSWREFVDSTQRQKLLATRYQIGSLRRRPEIAGYVLTQLSDVQWEANGVFDADRRPRVFADELALANGPSTVVLRPGTYAGYAGAPLDVTVDVVPPAGRRRAGRGVDRHDRGEPGRPAGAARAGRRPVQRPVRADDDSVAAWLPRLGVPAVRRADDDVLLVTRCFGPAAQAHARRGGRVLVLAEDRDALGGAFAAPLLARLSPREGDGDWVPRFDWLRRHGPLAALPGGPPLDLAFEPVIGDLVINFLPAPLRPAHLHSAMFAGWLRHRASTTLTVPRSRGAVTITTFRLRAAGADDPIAVTLTRALIDVARD